MDGIVHGVEKELDTIEHLSLHFTGGPVVRNLSVSAEDMGLIPGLRRSHMSQGNHVAQLLKPTNSRARELHVHGFSRQEYWSGLPFPSPGDLLNQGIELTYLMSRTLVDGFFTTSATWEAQ